jgi:hypothetical protein
MIWWDICLVFGIVSKAEEEGQTWTVGFLVLWRKVGQQRLMVQIKGTMAAKHKSRCVELQDVTDISFGRQNLAATSFERKLT